MACVRNERCTFPANDAKRNCRKAPAHGAVRDACAHHRIPSSGRRQSLLATRGYSMLMTVVGQWKPIATAGSWGACNTAVESALQKLILKNTCEQAGWDGVWMTFTLLTTNASTCCRHVALRWPYRQRQDRGMMADHSAMLGNHTSVVHGIDQPAGCESLCARTRRCNFFSHSAEIRTCVLCAACELGSSDDEDNTWLTGEQGRGRHAKVQARARRHQRLRMSSWSRGSAELRRTRVRLQIWLDPLLQANYSRGLYGGHPV